MLVASRHRVRIATWLFIVAAMIFVMIALGGATRLTGSGLSIMEWAPIMGTLPPLSDAEWQRLFGLYQKIPQYELVNKGMDLGGFQRIFLLEYLHRLWGRLLGLAFLLPLIGFTVIGGIPRRFIPALGLLFLLGGMQGAVGWFMVASGFDADSRAVAPVRLVLHLMFALMLYAAVLWIALGVLRPARIRVVPRARLATGLAVLLIALAITAGGFVAGLHAGLIYNSFPLMDGRLVPDGYWQMQPAWRNWLENLAAVQFNHRALATLAVLGAMIAAAIIRRTTPRSALALVGAALLQYSLGIATLILVVPIPLAIVHQAMAVLLLTAAIVALHAQTHA
ncbi:MAG: COX15/CtaA family protein [Acetobacteraceae bacterium]|nr:COX15/CtaA family protein [Acetobacteraceae bacterium]